MSGPYLEENFTRISDEVLRAIMAIAAKSLSQATEAGVYAYPAPPGSTAAYCTVEVAPDENPIVTLGVPDSANAYLAPFESAEDSAAFLIGEAFARAEFMSWEHTPVNMLEEAERRGRAVLKERREMRKRVSASPAASA